MPKHIGQLEKRKTQIKARRDSVHTELQEIDVPAPAGTFTTLANPSNMMAQTVQSSWIGPNANIYVRVRNETIRKYAKLSDKEICKKLDTELMQRGSPPMGFPESWTENYGVSNYFDAYENPKCRNLVQKMISKAKTGV